MNQNLDSRTEKPVDPKVLDLFKDIIDLVEHYIPDEPMMNFEKRMGVSEGYYEEKEKKKEEEDMFSNVPPEKRGAPWSNLSSDVMPFTQYQYVPTDTAPGFKEEEAKPSIEDIKHALDVYEKQFAEIDKQPATPENIKQMEDIFYRINVLKDAIKEGKYTASKNEAFGDVSVATPENFNKHIDRTFNPIAWPPEGYGKRPLYYEEEDKKKALSWEEHVEKEHKLGEDDFDYYEMEECPICDEFLRYAKKLAQKGSGALETQQTSQDNVTKDPYGRYQEGENHE
jgi:hypothetical protein